jgi:hypothetical protein
VDEETETKDSLGNSDSQFLKFTNQRNGFSSALFLTPPKIHMSSAISSPSPLLDFISKTRHSDPSAHELKSHSIPYECQIGFEKRPRSNRETTIGSKLIKSDRMNVSEDSFEKTDMAAVVVAAASIANSNQSTPIST